ncbi:MAG: geranylgeranylglyceryl/heptaprenylglyceryl phosphate synthase [Candidatus Reconcilbacillus cellulovorans]|uniref:Heptaprenylglyceryl phosphate synthase n=1 Tax=Candidatus Reconcilbacillus cellulovorans TaxID=1906605 RepID=A0A2A6E2S5_9BACL|nr:MAG: geranylgeranylglyceryl/heptaprenylglyceryl phosphate synthase [Candidatus Reconcilbacillus cellulovorans]
MNRGFHAWRHVFKLDPDRSIGDAELERVCLSGTDAVVVGGSTGVTADNTLELLGRIRRYPVDCALEISDPDAVAPGFDWYLVPVVLNAESADWVTRKAQQAVRRYGPLIPWDRLVPEGYIVLNADSAVARLTRPETALGAEDVAAYAELAERLFRFPIVYLEYSGVFGDMDVLRHVRKRLRSARLFYGGGVDGPDRAKEAAQWADTVVVGNAVYRDLERALATVAAVGVRPGPGELPR